MGKTFRKVILCSTNDHAPRKNDKIRGWVEANGGRFTLEMSPDVTHLIASKQAWKSDAPLGTMVSDLELVAFVSLSQSKQPAVSEPSRSSIWIGSSRLSCHETEGH